MVYKYLDASKASSLNQRFRLKRFEFFKSLINDLPRPIKILDIGGTQNYWERMNFVKNDDIHITLLNLEEQAVTNSNFKSVVGDATDLSEFKDSEFDIVYSNSVIEHLFTKDNQKNMASEVKRVGQYYFIQTPNLYFPVEPHWLFPFFQFFPFALKVYLTQNFDLGNYEKAGTREAAIQRVNEVKLLNRNEMKQLFDCGKLYEEKLFLLTKSLTMYNFK